MIDANLDNGYPTTLDNTLIQCKICNAGYIITLDSKCTSITTVDITNPNNGLSNCEVANEMNGTTCN